MVTLKSVLKNVLSVLDYSRCSKEFSSMLASRSLVHESIEYKISGQYEGQQIDNDCMLIGEHENQISEGGESELRTHWVNCKKNPGHPEFIPIESFSLEHLPEGYSDIDLHEFIKAVADLTVRISVTMTSPDRPEFWPKSKSPYFLSELRGKKTFRSGTGMVSRVLKKTAKDDQKCPCDKCKDSDKPSKAWWEIYVHTAAHVVVDDLEARHTTLRLFYNSEDEPYVTIKDDICAYDVNIEMDRCELAFVTCDGYLGNKLEKMVEDLADRWRSVFTKYYKDRGVHKLSFIVSHPHGCTKQVSVGHWTDKVQLGLCNNKFKYATCTCPGSSGASVYCVGYSGMLYKHVHCGSVKSYNYSAIGSTFNKITAKSRIKSRTFK